MVTSEKIEKDINFEQTIQNLITKETDLGLFEIETYTEWQKEIELERSKFLIKLQFCY